jgi:hypothetical protein
MAWIGGCGQQLRLLGMIFLRASSLNIARSETSSDDLPLLDSPRFFSSLLASAIESTVTVPIGT